jgi:hypothetical protein
MARKPRGGGTPQDVDQQIRDVSKLVQTTLGEISASDLTKGGRPGSPQARGCFGTFGTLGSATGTFGTFGTLGSMERKAGGGGRKG